MDLLISAQDIARVTYGLGERGVLTVEQETEASPERYLFVLESFLSAQKKTTKDITRVLVVTGPGSFTASRVSVTMANTIAYARHIPIIGQLNEERLPLRTWYEMAVLAPEQSFAVPAYDRPPNIT